MSATTERDQAARLAGNNPKAALAKALRIGDPWFRAQALACVARYAVGDPLRVAALAAGAAAECPDDYQRSAVRAWEIAALAGRGHPVEARRSLHDALTLATCAQPPASRSEALMLLLQAAFVISRVDACRVFAVLTASCPAESHWQCRRAQRDAEKMLAGGLVPRPFFW